MIAITSGSNRDTIAGRHADCYDELLATRHLRLVTTDPLSCMTCTIESHPPLEPCRVNRIG